METRFWNKFDAGWCPSDDAINGRPNGLLKMSNVELDENGAIQLCNGTSVIATIGGGGAVSHTIFSRFISGVRHDYLSLNDGTTYRDTTLLNAAGSLTRAAYSTAFDYVLIANNSYRVKDSGSGVPNNLGIMTPSAAPNIQALIFKSPKLIPTGSPNNFYGAAAIVANVGGVDYLTQFQPDITDFNFVFATTATPVNSTVLTQTNFGSTTTESTDNDFIVINPFTMDGLGNPDSSGVELNGILSIQLKIYLTAPTAIAPTIQDASDYYTYSWTSDLAQNDDDIRSVSGSSILLAPRRGQFTRVGADGTKSWKTVVGYSLVIKFASALTANLGFNFTQQFQGGYQGSLNGNIQYAQMNIARTNAYVGKSVLGPIGTGAGFVNFGAAILAQVPTDPQVNEVWIFRRDGGLGEWYRILAIPIVSIATRFIDPYSNDDAITLGITVNLNLVSTASIDPILEIIGPIEGRWYYITAKYMYPSDIQNPDLVDVSKGIRTCGSESEIFLWARKISEAQVMIGTSVDVYSFTGTFATLPDDSIDAFYRPIGIKYPPIARDAVAFGGTIYYFSSIGWMTVSTGGQNNLLTAPNIDSLYRGEARYGYPAPTIKGDAPDSVTYPICIAKGKLWCVITGTARIEVFDFVRNYWRPIELGLGDVHSIFATQDGQVIAHFGDYKLRTLDDQSTKLIDGVTNQLVTILSTAQDGSLPRNRKDLSTLKSRIFTNSSNLVMQLITDVGTASIGYLNSVTANKELFLDVSGVLAKCKWWQFNIFGTVSDLLLQDLSLDFDPRPTPTTFLRGRNDNFGTASKKRVRVWPFVLDTLGANVLFTPYVDNVAHPAVYFNTPDKDTVLYQFTQDAFGKDYGYTLQYQGALEFEFYGGMNPEIVQVLPIAKHFDQLGPQEIFRYGKITKVDIRILAFGGTSIPYKIYFDDILLVSDSLAVIDGQEGSFTINLPKGTSGAIFRMELGPTSFDFHRFNIRILTNVSGTQSEGQWVTIG